MNLTRIDLLADEIAQVFEGNSIRGTVRGLISWSAQRPSRYGTD